MTSQHPHEVAALLWAVIILGLFTGLLGFLAAQQTGGTFIYPLDDAYIHLSLARSLSQHGVWGVTPHEFSSVASSIGWPLQLAGLMLLAGPQEWLPLALGAAWALATLIFAWRILTQVEPPASSPLLPLLLVVLLPSLPLLILIGMEHAMQAAAALAFAWVAARVLTAEKPLSGDGLLLGLLAALVTAARYEGMFEVALVVLAALPCRRWREMILVSLCGALPIVVFGLYSVAQGGHWLPNPILVKSDLREVHSFQDFVVLVLQTKLAHFNRVALVTVLMLVSLGGVQIDRFWQRRLTAAEQLFVLLAAATAILHFLGARVGWFMRYEAYLLVLQAVALGVAWRGQVPALVALWRVQRKPGCGSSGRAFSCLLVILVVLLALVLNRLSISTFQIPLASQNIHDQQVQMGRFLGVHYPNEPVIVNDLGAVCWWGQVRPVDLMGLATQEVAQAMLGKGQYTSHLLTQLARKRGARIAAVFATPEWMPAPIPPVGWIEAGCWTVPYTFIVGDATVHFFGLDAEAAKQLARNLEAFRGQLPAGVKCVVRL